jgi:hypothetical protein
MREWGKRKQENDDDDIGEENFFGGKWASVASAYAMISHYVMIWDTVAQVHRGTMVTKHHRLIGRDNLSGLYNKNDSHAELALKHCS